MHNKDLNNHFTTNQEQIYELPTVEVQRYFEKNEDVENNLVS